MLYLFVSGVFSDCHVITVPTMSSACRKLLHPCSPAAVAAGGGGALLLGMVLSQPASEEEEGMPPPSSSPFLQRRNLLARKLHGENSAASDAKKRVVRKRHLARRIVGLQGSLSPGQKLQLAQSHSLGDAVALAREARAGQDLFLSQPRIPPEWLEGDSEQLLKVFLSSAFRRLSDLQDGDSELCASLEKASVLSHVLVESGEEGDSAHLENAFLRDSHQLILPEKEQPTRLARLDSLLQVLAALTESARAREPLLLDMHLSPVLQRVLLEEGEEGRASDQRHLLRIRGLCSKIFLHMSRSRGLHDYLFRAGWVGVLRRWSEDPEPRVCLAAATALANMDGDGAAGRAYPEGVYLLSGGKERPALDVVVIHGLMGGVFYTWRQRDVGNRDGDGIPGKIFAA